MKDSPQWKRLGQTLLILTVGIFCVYLWKFWGALEPTHYTIKRTRINAVLHARDSSSNSLPTLWHTAGCASNHPIFQCQAKNKFCGRKILKMVTVQDYKDNVYLKSAPYDNCSLVGSSGNLKNHAYGDLIDRNNIVIRINNAPVKGYEQMVGHRPADIVIHNNHVHDEKCMVKTGHQVLYVCCTPLPLGKREKATQDCPLYHTDEMYSMSNHIFRTVKDTLKVYGQRYHVNVTGDNYVHPSSGLKAVLFSMLLCREVHMFGFGMEGAKTFHYYSNNTEYRPPHHEMSLEMRIIKDIANGTIDSNILNLAERAFGRVILHR